MYGISVIITCSSFASEILFMYYYEDVYILQKIYPECKTA